MSDINDLLTSANASKPAEFTTNFHSILKDRIDNKIAGTSDETEDPADPDKTDDKGGETDPPKD